MSASATRQLGAARGAIVRSEGSRWRHRALSAASRIENPVGSVIDRCEWGFADLP